MNKVFRIMLCACFMAAFALSAVAGEKVTLTFAAIKMYSEDPMKPLIDKYEQENPHVKINFIQLPSPNSSTEVHQWLVTNLGSSAGDVDVVTADCIWFPEFASAGWLLDVSKYFTEAEKKEHFNGTIQTVTYRGKMYGAPWYVDGGLLYYRKDLLEKHGVKAPATWDELIAGAKKILDAEQNPRLNGFLYQAKQAEVLVCDLVEFLGSRGAVLDESGKVVINNEFGKRAARLMHDLIFKHKLSPREVNTFDEEPSRTVFTDGNALFLRNWTYVWNVAQNPENSSVVGKVGIVPVPAFDGSNSASCLGGYQWAVSGATKNPDEAVKFAKFLSGYESQMHFARMLSLAPTRPALFDDPELKQINPFLVELKDVFTGSTPRPITPLYPDVSLAVQSTFSKICSTENIDIDRELDNLAKEIELISSMLD